MSDSTLSAKIAVKAATYSIDKPYDYAIPDCLKNKIQPGCRVIVPFGRGSKPTEGIVLSIENYTGAYSLKSISELPDQAPILSQELIQLAFWIRERYFCTFYDAVQPMLPAGLSRGIKDKVIKYVSLEIPSEDSLSLANSKDKRAPLQAACLRLLSDMPQLAYSELCYFTGASGLTVQALEKHGYIKITEEEFFRRPFNCSNPIQQIPKLNAEQQTCANGILALEDGKQSSCSLLYGVTGSGKTTVYIHLIHHMLEQQKSSILLVPEISLTPQMIRVFSTYFGDEVAVIHSALSDGERYDEWKRIRAGKAHVVIGTRSAIFSPVSNLGLVIIDEEQEYTYKSENAPRYHARDVAKYRCSQNNALLLLGSATPDLETMYQAKIGNYHLFTLKHRFNEKALPMVEIVDLKKELQDGRNGEISNSLNQALAENISKHEQSILFINRRGTFSLVSCSQCGYTYKCPNCSVNLTYHRFSNQLMCHHCGYTQKVDALCPECNGMLKTYGLGTEKIEDELSQSFTDTEIIRMDADSVSHVGSHERLLTEFYERNVPILVGTQMVTKGLDFENVTLVGVLNADQALYSGNYRSNEHCFSLITQVIGRAGRGSKTGRAIIQTFTPLNPIIRFAANQDYDGFYASEIQYRKLLNSPPFYDILSISVSSSKEEQAIEICKFMKQAFEKNIAAKDYIQILGPAPFAVVKVNNKFRYQISIHCKFNTEMRKIVSSLLVYCGKEKQFRDAVIYADLNPIY